ncbi:MAG: DUF2203 domain-containing protein [Nitrospinota bacterium]|nr:DUF2203 domain-containing protein [Nitrospinota bacterium]
MNILSMMLLPGRNIDNPENITYNQRCQEFVSTNLPANFPEYKNKMPEKKYFSLEEANSIVPKLLKKVPEMQGLTEKLQKGFPDVEKARKKAQQNGGSVEGGQYLETALSLNNLIKEFESKGCILKGISEGLVDFPSIRDGREVYLCWKAPEERIEYWHDIDAGFAGRRKI